MLGLQVVPLSGSSVMVQLTESHSEELSECTHDWVMTRAAQSLPSAPYSCPWLLCTSNLLSCLYLHPASSNSAGSLPMLAWQAVPLGGSSVMVLMTESFVQALSECTQDWVLRIAQSLPSAPFCCPCLLCTSNLPHCLCLHLLPSLSLHD